MTRSRIEALQDTALFGAIREDTIESVLERARVVSIAAGDYFFHEGDAGNQAFLLETGDAEVLKEWGALPQRLRGLRAGDCFGEVALLDFGPRSASIRAVSDCCALEISASNLHKIAVCDAQQFALIYMNLGRELSRRLREADERLFRARYGGEPAADGYRFDSASL